MRTLRSVWNTKKSDTGTARTLNSLLVNEKLHFTEHGAISEKFPFFRLSVHSAYSWCVCGWQGGLRGDGL